MPSYPRRSQPFRKQEILEKRETGLRHALEHDYPQSKIEKAAEQVRDAHLKLYKGKIEQFRYTKVTEGGPVPGAKARRDYEEWEQLDVEEIIEKYTRDT